jgi:hypothetical protein
LATGRSPGRTEARGLVRAHAAGIRGRRGVDGIRAGQRW